MDKIERRDTLSSAPSGSFGSSAALSTEAHCFGFPASQTTAALLSPPLIPSVFGEDASFLRPLHAGIPSDSRSGPLPSSLGDLVRYMRSTYEPHPNPLLPSWPRPRTSDSYILVLRPPSLYLQCPLGSPRHDSPHCHPLISRRASTQHPVCFPVSGDKEVHSSRC